MIKPVGADELKPLFVYDSNEHEALSKEAEGLPSVVISSAAAGNAVMMGGGYFTPLTGYMNVADAMGCAENMKTTDGKFFPVPVLNLVEDVSFLVDIQCTGLDHAADLISLTPVPAFVHHRCRSFCRPRGDVHCLYPSTLSHHRCADHGNPDFYLVLSTDG